MTAPADRARRTAGGAAPAGHPQPGARPSPDERWTPAGVDNAFAAIVARHAETDPPAAIPPAERCDEAAGPGGPTGSPELRADVGRIASALFCASGLNAELLCFAIGRVAEHHTIDRGEVTDRIVDEVVRIAAALTPGGHREVPSLGS